MPARSFTETLVATIVCSGREFTCGLLRRITCRASRGQGPLLQGCVQSFSQAGPAPAVQSHLARLKSQYSVPHTSTTPPINTG